MRGWRLVSYSDAWNSHRKDFRRFSSRFINTLNAQDEKAHPEGLERNGPMKNRVVFIHAGIKMLRTSYLGTECRRYKPLRCLDQTRIRLEKPLGHHRGNGNDYSVGLSTCTLRNFYLSHLAPMKRKAGRKKKAQAHANSGTHPYSNDVLRFAKSGELRDPEASERLAGVGINRIRPNSRQPPAGSQSNSSHYSGGRPNEGRPGALHVAFSWILRVKLAECRGGFRKTTRSTRQLLEERRDKVLSCVWVQRKSGRPKRTATFRRELI